MEGVNGGGRRGPAGAPIMLSTIERNYEKKEAPDL